MYKHHDVFILGQLESSGYEPVLNVSIMPWSTKNLAPSVWHKASTESGASSPVTLNMNSMSLRQLGDLPKILFPRPCDRRDASLCVETWQEKGEGILLYTQQQQLGSTDNPNE